MSKPPNDFSAQVRRIRNQYETTQQGQFPDRATQTIHFSLSENKSRYLILLIALILLNLITLYGRVQMAAVYQSSVSQMAQLRSEHWKEKEESDRLLAELGVYQVSPLLMNRAESEFELHVPKPSQVVKVSPLPDSSSPPSFLANLDE